MRNEIREIGVVEEFRNKTGERGSHNRTHIFLPTKVARELLGIGGRQRPEIDPVEAKFLFAPADSILLGYFHFACRLFFPPLVFPGHV